MVPESHTVQGVVGWAMRNPGVRRADSSSRQVPPGARSLTSWGTWACVRVGWLLQVLAHLKLQEWWTPRSALPRQPRDPRHPVPGSHPWLLAALAAPRSQVDPNKERIQTACTWPPLPDAFSGNLRSEPPLGSGLRRAGTKRLMAGAGAGPGSPPVLPDLPEAETPLGTRLPTPRTRGVSSQHKPPPAQICKSGLRAGLRGARPKLRFPKALGPTRGEPNFCPGYENSTFP